jgi:hypothetical protein
MKKHRRSETIAFATLAVVWAVTILLAVSTVRDSAPLYEQIEVALTNMPTLYAVTNTNLRGLPPRAASRAADRIPSVQSGARIRGGFSGTPIF